MANKPDYWAKNVNQPKATFIKTPIKKIAAPSTKKK
jgi:hypothetical protein